MFRSSSWAPTIALSWLWGLGFFYSFQITVSNGWVGFAAFALPNALGLAAFGYVLGDPRRDAAAIFAKVQTRYASLFLACQVLAVALTIFASVAYLFIPLFGIQSVAVVAIFLLLATAVGHSATMRALKLLHLGYLVVGVAAAIVLLAGLARSGHFRAVPVAALDGRFYGLVLPTLVGFLLGPWMDIQHWQRVVAIRESGGCARRAYLWGGLLFLGLISLNAAIAAAAGPALRLTTADGIQIMQATVAGAVARTGSGLLAAALVVWAGVAIASTLDSFYFATRWLLRATTSRSESPLLAFVPIGLVTSPIWFLVTAILVAVLMIDANLGMIYLMMPFATLLAGAAACLFFEGIGGRPRYDGTLCAMIGAAAYLVLVVGYIGDVPAMMDLAPLIALIGALPAAKALRAGAVAPRTELAVAAAAEMHALKVEPDAAVLGHGFDGQWYFMHLVPTYDDTNSVGNVYFANYFRWIGKARELLFNSCMPDFDLQNTAFYVLTKSFQHDFRREIREFTPVTVRLRMSTYNRKFVTLEHEIHSKTDGLVGKGEQTLMFVDSTQFKPLDIPPVILRSFMPFFAQALRLNAPRAPGPRDVAAR